MAITTLTPESITFELDHERRQSIASYSQYSSYSSSNSNSSPELSSPIYSIHGKASLATPRSDSSHDSPRVIPKVEELDEHATTLSKLPELPEAEDEKPTVEVSGPRKRGRPRKHPVVEQKRSAHARSKTGCGTCRRRKKKCDETRPSCTNCEKNNVICDGYEHKKPWRSGREKALINRQATTLPPIPTFNLFNVDNTVDYRFFDYFIHGLSEVLSINTSPGKNPFVEMIVPMAVNHPGLMSSLLYLSGSVLLTNSPTKDPQMEARVKHNNEDAVKLITEDIKQLVISGNQPDMPVATIADPSIAQGLLLFLETVAAGALNGQWRSHMSGMKIMLTSKGEASPSEQFRRFVLEFTLYHDFSSAITSMVNPLDDYSDQLMEEFQNIKLPALVTPEVAALLGVMDGLFLHISQIRRLRDQMRIERAHGRNNNHSQVWGTAYQLHQDLSTWKCQYEENTPRYWASLLYRQCVVLYLHRTIHASRPLIQFKQGVDDGLRYLRQLPRDQDDQGTQSILLLPLFLLGVSAFEPEQRPEIRDAFIRLQEWSKLANISYAREIIEEIWVMMDTGRAEETWDWERIIEQKGWDFLIT